MITITDDQAEIRFAWPTNDTNGVLKMMTNQAASLLAGHGRQVTGGVKFHNIERVETGFEFVFKAKLKPLEVPSE